MQLEIEMESSFCATSKFIINGIKADSYDFGDQADRDSDSADRYCCGDMRFTKVDPAEDVLSKYKISELEYNLMAELLEEELSFGGCGLCE